MDKGWERWGPRFREMVRAKDLTLAEVAENLRVAESTVRSWTNANRSIKLGRFFALCDAAGLDPAVVLFAGSVDPEWLTVGKAWVVGDKLQRGVLLTAAKGVLAEHGQAAPQGNAARKARP